MAKKEELRKAEIITMMGQLVTSDDKPILLIIADENFSGFKSHYLYRDNVDLIALLASVVSSAKEFAKKLDFTEEKLLEFFKKIEIEEGEKNENNN